MYASEPAAPTVATESLGDGVSLERTGRWSALAFAEPRPVLSSAPVRGGDTRARRIVNLSVDGPDVRALCDDPAGGFHRLVSARGWTGPVVGLMTGVAAERLGLARTAVEKITWHVLATVGLRNAHRAGECPPSHDGAGTINLIAYTPQGLTPGARAEALMLMTEAKTAALADHAIVSASSDRIATGTGTDAAAIACDDGDDAPYTGYHTASGQALVDAVHRAMAMSLASGG